MPEERLSVSRKALTVGRESSCTKPKNLYGSRSSVYQIPDARVKGGVLVPFALTACIPETAIRKFATKVPFVVEINENGIKRFVFYFGD
jgi:hypothetical protein